MGVRTGTNLADRAWAIFSDAIGGTATRWQAPEMLNAINDGQREVVTVLPKALTKTQNFLLAAGTRQHLPTIDGAKAADATTFVRYLHNGSSGSPGRAPVVRPIGWLDNERPTWHTDAAGPAQVVMHDPAEPLVFYVWPKADGTTHNASIVHGALPADLTDLTQQLALPDIHFNAQLYYLCFRMAMKQTGYARNALAGSFYQLFLQSLGVRDATTMASDINLQAIGDGAGMTGGKP